MITNYQTLKRQVVEMQEELVLRAYEQAGQNKTAAAIAIGMSRRQFQRIFTRWEEAQK